jgi:hypothetical protein
MPFLVVFPVPNQRVRFIQSMNGRHVTRSKKICPCKVIQTRGVSHIGLVIYIKKYLKAKEKLQKLKYFHHAKI